MEKAGSLYLTLQKTKALRWYLLVMTLGVVTYVLITRATIPIFLVKEVFIEAAPPIRVEEIQAKLPSLVGRPLFSIHADHLISLLKEQIWVDSVVVKKEFPKRIRISLTPKKVAALRLKDKKLWFLDEKGGWIEEVSTDLLSLYSMPILSYEGAMTEMQWEFKEITQMIQQMSQTLSPDYKVSQVILLPFPYFKVFLQRPEIEVHLSYDTWESQVMFLKVFLQNPPASLLVNSPKSPIPPLSLNLRQPKKAVVRRQVSK